MRGQRRHPDERALALLAGGDLGLLRNRRVAWHVSRCARCRASVAKFEAMRSRLARESNIPDVDYEALARRIRAAVATKPRADRSWQWGWTAAFAASAVTATLVAMLMLPERPDGPQRVSSSRAQAPLPVATIPFEADEAQVTAEGGLSVRSYDALSGTLTITDYYAP